MCQSDKGEDFFDRRLSGHGLVAYLSGKALRYDALFGAGFRQSTALIGLGQP